MAAKTQTEIDAAPTPPLDASDNDAALLLAGTTGVLRYLLENGQVRHNLPSVLGADLNLSALPPDRVKTGEDERPQINLYLYQATAKGLGSVSRFAPQPEQAMNGAASAQSWAGQKGGLETEFEMVYLVTVFGSQDLHWEILHGYALALLRENPILSGNRLREIWERLADGATGRDVPPALAPLRDAPLRHRLKEARLTLLSPPLEQVGQIWSLLQARYRPTLFLRAGVTLLPPGQS